MKHKKKIKQNNTWQSYVCVVFTINIKHYIINNTTDYNKHLIRMNTKHKHKASIYKTW